MNEVEGMMVGVAAVAAGAVRALVGSGEEMGAERQVAGEDRQARARGTAADGGLRGVSPSPAAEPVLRVCDR